VVLSGPARVGFPGRLQSLAAGKQLRTPLGTFGGEKEEKDDDGKLTMKS